MPRKAGARVRVPAVVEGRRLAQAAAIRLGQWIRQARERRRWTQRQLGDKVGLSRAQVGYIESGKGSGVPPRTWFGLSVALDAPLRLEFGRDALDKPADAGHLSMQELMLRLGRQLGIRRSFELPTRPADPALSVDVCWRDDARRVLIIAECWNTFGNINAAVRSTRRKIAEAEQLAAATITAHGGEPYRVAACWIVRSTRRNRELLASYPEVFATAFPASSRAWVRALAEQTAPVPAELGLVWADAGATHLLAWRRRVVPDGLSRDADSAR
jgi:transcriptional regulator with XRE-family HTH domain